MEAEAEEDGPEIPASVIGSKLAEYEGFVEKVLKAELRRSLDDFRQQRELLEQCRELRRGLDQLVQGSVTELETMVELGCQFFAKALVPDTSRVFVDVGLGFRLEMPLADARDFLSSKEEYLLGVLELRKRRTAQIKADVHEALHLMDLMLQVQGGGKPWLEQCDQTLIDSFSG
mmetsp:Transcript_33427/g.105943  ORF Transcript_33427/g.105943 Transcript_33427/m.105943 type:complete len:174 (+) Transcript_33427:50-571(+)